MPQEQESGNMTSRIGQDDTEHVSQERVDGGFAAQASDLDALLDDIESTLETNAEEYVSSFVQKGGE